VENQIKGTGTLNMVERVCADKEKESQKRGLLLWALPPAFCSDH